MIASWASPETVPRRLTGALEASRPRAEASERPRACPRRPGVDVEDVDMCEKEGDVCDCGADVGGGGGGCGPVALRFLGELVYSTSEA
jgi:hypothetical protein